jgi:hypothetical protein
MRADVFNLKGDHAITLTFGIYKHEVVPDLTIKQIS